MNFGSQNRKISKIRDNHYVPRAFNFTPFGAFRLRTNSGKIHYGMIPALKTPDSIDPKKCMPSLRSIYKMAVRRLPEKSSHFSLFGAPQVTQCSVGCSAPYSLLDPVLDCSVRCFHASISLLPWLFDASISLSAVRNPPCCSDRHSLDQLVPS